MQNSRRGFTLIELLIVIAIIGILVTIVIVAINPAKILFDTENSKRETEINQIKTALQVYYNDNADYPAANALVCKLQGSGAAPCTASDTTVYMRQVPHTNIYGYTRLSSSNYLLGTPLRAVSPYTVGDSDAFTKCKVNSTDTSYTFTPIGGGSTFNVTSTDGYLACPD